MRFLSVIIVLISILFVNDVFAQNKENKVQGKDKKENIVRPNTIKETFFTGTNHELEVYKIYGRVDGPTMLILGGIQGDEPGGFLSADSYADIKLEKGNLIVVPRANFYSIMLFDREVKGVDMNRLFEKSPNDWQGDVVGKIKEYMKESDIFLNLHDGWGYHNPEYISWAVSPDRFGYSVIVDEEEFTCKDGRVLKLGEMARTAMNAANEKIPSGDPKKHYFNTETGKKSTRHKDMRKTATWYAVADLCIPAFGIEGSKNMKIEKNVLYHNYVINEFIKIAGIEIEYPNTHTYTPEFKGAVVKVNDRELFIRNKNKLTVVPGEVLRVTEIISNYKRGLTCDIINFGNLNDLNKDIKVTKDMKIIFRKDHIVMGSINIVVDPEANERAISYIKQDIEKHKNEMENNKNNTSIEKPTNEKKAETVDKNKSKKVEKPVSQNVTQNDVIFVVNIDGVDTNFNSGQNIAVKNGQKVRFVKVITKSNQEINSYINVKGWFPGNNSNVGDDRGYTINIPPSNMLKRYSVRGEGVVYPVLAHDSKTRKRLATVYLEFVDLK